MHKKFEINQTKIKGGCQSGRKKVPFNSKSDLSIAVLTGLAVLSVSAVSSELEANHSKK